MNEQELNKKLAEWAGFIKKEGNWWWPSWFECQEQPIPDGIMVIDFTKSLDACFKWLVPKLQDKGHLFELLAFEHKGFRATIYEECFSQRGSNGFDPYLNPKFQEDNDNPALALCKAIEKLIDSGG